MNKKLIHSIIVIIIVLIDQLTKFLVTLNLPLAKEVILIPNFFSLMYIKNTGAAFSSFLGHRLLLIFISIICIFMIVNLIYREKYENKLQSIVLSIILGGMIGNLIDRIFLGSVVDFIALNIFDYRFPIFNIADICITCGVAIYLIICIINDKKKEKENY